MTKITRGSYRLGFAHPDVAAALEALPATERTWFQNVIGQGITGHPTPDGVVPICYGTGSNGKTALTSGAMVEALGDYGTVASHKLFTAMKAETEHSTEIADLKGCRLIIGEELTEGRSLNVTAIKRIMDTPKLKARFIRQNNIEFAASHSLFLCTNYRPIISETDHGIWRRLALLTFPYTFVRRESDITCDTDKIGDAELKQRLRAGADGQHDALVTWAVNGATAWYADKATALLPTERIET